MHKYMHIYMNVYILRNRQRLREKKARDGRPDIKKLAEVGNKNTQNTQINLNK